MARLADPRVGLHRDGPPKHSPGGRWPGRLPYVEITVWIADWQLQCCGDPFRRGERIAWTVLKGLDSNLPQRLAEVLGDPAVTVDAIEEHHQGEASEVEPVIGTVASIRAVSCRLAPVTEGSRTYVQIPGSGVTTEVEMADGWTEPPSGTELMGYLVELTGAARGDDAHGGPP